MNSEGFELGQVWIYTDGCVYMAYMVLDASRDSDIVTFLVLDSSSNANEVGRVRGLRVKGRTWEQAWAREFMWKRVA